MLLRHRAKKSATADTTLTWRGFIVFPDPMVPDGCHVCVKEYPDFVPYMPLCIFIM
jgi:hypothetical protein